MCLLLADVDIMVIALLLSHASTANQIRLGDFYRSFVEEEARRMGKTLDEVRTWAPPAKLSRKNAKEVF
jgi:hypothetical protein